MGSGIKFISEVLNQKGAPALYEDIIDNRPAATFEGRLFFATDVVNGDTIFRDNGDGTWSALAGNGGGGGVLGADNGLTLDPGNLVGLGAGLVRNTDIDIEGYILSFNYYGAVLLLDTQNDLYYFGKGNALDAGCGTHTTATTIYTQYSFYPIGIELDFFNQIYKFGDFNNSANAGTSLFIDDTTQVIQTKSIGNEIGLKLDFGFNTYQLGDYNDTGNGTTLKLDNTNNVILTRGFNSDIGLKLDFQNANYLLGDFGNQNNGSSFGVDDDQQTLTCTQVTSLDPGLLIAGWIKIKVDGNYYVLPYYSI